MEINMKKILLFAIIVSTMVACSKDNKDEPGGGNNQNNGNESAITYNLMGYFTEITSAYQVDGFSLNHSPAYNEWMIKYGENFETQTNNVNNTLNISTTGSYFFKDYAFIEADAVAAEFANFSLGARINETDNSYVMNSCGATIACEMYKNSKFVSSYDVEYFALMDPEYSNFSADWCAIFRFAFTNIKNISNYEIPKNIQNWINTHGMNLTNSVIGSNGSIEYEWTFDFSNYDSNYINNEIIPFLQYTSIGNYETTSVKVYHRNDKVTRYFVGSNP